MNDRFSEKAGTWFDNAASKVGASTSARHLFFLLATVAAVAAIGYHFGTFDQAVHIPFLAKYGDASLYPNDPFLDMRFEHYSFFWFLFLPFQQAHILEPAMLAAHFVFTYCTFWAIWDLTETLFHNSLSSFVAVLALILPHITFGGFPIIEFSVLNRTAVLPFLLWVIVLGLRRRRTAMFMLLGILFNFHIISVTFTLAMVGFELLCRKQWKALIQGTIVFMIFAMPVILWRAIDHQPMGLSPDYPWFNAVTNGVLANLFYLFSPQPHILFVTFSGIASIALFFIARREVESEHNQSVTRFITAAIILVGLQIVIVLYPITLVMQMQIVRAGIPATLLATIYFAHYLASQIRSRMSIIALVVSPSAIYPLVVWALRSRMTAHRKFDAAAGVVGAAVCAGILGIGWVAGLWYPGIYPYGPSNNWRDVQNWARDHTAVDAVFITPPQLMGPYTPDWRAFSRRSTVASLSDLLEIAVIPSGFDAWEERFKAVAPGAQVQFRGNFFENVAITKNAYESLTPDQIASIARRYKATYLVSEKPRVYDYPVAYENAEFTLYEIGK